MVQYGLGEKFKRRPYWNELRKETNMESTIKEKVQVMGAKQMLKYLEKDPETNIPKIVDWLDKYSSEDGIAKEMRAVKPILQDKDNNWNKLIMKFYTDVDPRVRKKLFENFIVNSALLGLPEEKRNREKYDCNIPWAILMDLTSACNLHCTGCWAAEYGNSMNLTFDELDNIVEQAKALGTYAFILSGGEPLVRKKDLIRLCEKHNDCLFSPFTNGTLIDEEFADEMLRVGNLIPAISIEGYEEDTDFRRGKGTYKGLMRGMKILKDKGLPFGTSLCYTSKNAESISSSEYFDFLIDNGAYFSWIFTYIPIGSAAAPELVASAEQREMMYHRVREYRKTKPIFTIDFWNDGEYINGCIAGGKNYLHINANGDIEPCAFIHYSDSNIREKTLLEAYKSPLFMSYRRHQPFNENLLRPCPMFDNIGALAEMVDETGAKSTDIVDPEDVHDMTAKCVKPATAWAPVAQKLWDSSPAGQKAAERKKAQEQSK